VAPVGDWDIDMLAAGLRRDSADLTTYVHVLLDSLAEALPPDVIQVEHAHGLLRTIKGGEAPVTAVHVTVADRRYSLRQGKHGGAPAATIAHQSGGVVMSSQEVPVDDWSQALAAALAHIAERNARAASALQRIAISGWQP
jgi:hypothetical protein